MRLLILLETLGAAAMAGWLVTLLRDRGDEIPCTARAFSVKEAGLGVLVLLGCAFGNVYAAEAIDGSIPISGPALFALWLLVQAAVSILFIAVRVVRASNRTAAAWLRLAGPEELIVRRSATSTVVRLARSRVQAFWVPGGMAGTPMYVQYVIRSEGAALDLVVPFRPHATGANVRRPWVRGITGVVAQGGARRLHRLLAPFCEAPETT